MTYELLVSTMNQTDDSLVDKMRIQSDAIIINQTNCFEYKETQRNDSCIRMFSFAERGVGLSRNSAFMRSTADIIEFADDDMIFEDGYEDAVLKEFEKHPEADAILFSIDSLNSDRPFHRIESFKRVGRVEARKYGCARLAIRREKMIYHNLSFSLLFGGGAVYGAGEDTVFLKRILDAGLKLYKSPVKVADVEQETSSWFSGYTEKYFYDKGALIEETFPYFARLIAWKQSMKHRESGFTQKKLFEMYCKGINDYRHKKMIE